MAIEKAFQSPFNTVADFFIRVFLMLTKIESASDEDNLEKDPPISPTTPGQLTVLEAVRAELQNMGINAVIDKYGYLIARLPANELAGSDAVPFALVFHPDTSPEGKGMYGVNPTVVTYEGGDIVRPNSIPISLHDNPHLAGLVGQQIVISDGTSLLGADDKAGAAEILTAIQFLLNHPELPHGEILIIGAPDEEVGAQLKYLQYDELKVACAYTVDGGVFGEYSAETFNAETAVVTIKGVQAHPGEAKAKGMVNALEVLMHILKSVTDPKLLPQLTEGREPFIMPLKVGGNYARAELAFLLRAFEDSELEMLRMLVRRACQDVMSRVSRSQVECKFLPSYRNMAQYLGGKEWVTEALLQAMKRSNVEPRQKATRGGTDGSRLTEKGIPCPNLFTGAMNMHSPTEHLPVPWAMKAVEVLVNLAVIHSRHVS